MSDNNPFDRPPEHLSTPPPVSGDWKPTTPYNPIGSRQSGPGRGKIAFVALGAAALTGGAIFGISKFAGDDDVTLAEASAEATAAPALTAGSENVGSENVGGDNGAAAPLPSLPEMFSSISECMDIDGILGTLGAGNAGSVTMGSMPSMDFTTISESVGNTVTITGADGVTVYSFGEGDASIAISKSGGEITVAAAGDVTETTSFDFSDFETHMNDLMAELEGLDFDSMNIEEMLEGLDFGSMVLENMDLENMDLGDMPAVPLPADFDPAEIQACIENLNLGG